jgi:hypothetical protein
MSTSNAKALANRRNASMSTGPRTLAGKARSSRNAQRHGIRAAAVVLPHAERAEDWEAHHAAVLADLDFIIEAGRRETRNAALGRASARMRASNARKPRKRGGK